MKKKKGILKYIFITLGIILVIFSIVIGYLVITDLKQEDLLKKELVNLANKDLLNDNYDIKVKTTGDYAYIEEAVKSYYKKLSDNIKLINSYLNDEELINILSLENISKDKPNFNNSYKILNDTKEKVDKSLTEIINLCNEDTIKNLIDKEKVDDYSYELYLELMYTKDDIEEFNNTKNEMKTIGDNLNAFLDKVEAILNLLKDNSNSWFIENNELYFKTNSLVNKYNSLYNDLNTFVKDKFSKYNNNDTTITQTNI